MFATGADIVVADVQTSPATASVSLPAPPARLYNYVTEITATIDDNAAVAITIDWGNGIVSTHHLTQQFIFNPATPVRAQLAATPVTVTAGDPGGNRIVALTIIGFHSPMRHR